MPEILETKACKKCGLRLPLTEFWFSKNAKDGKRGSCKKCVGLQINELKEQHILATCNFKTSTRCQEQYNISLYEYNKNTKRNSGKYRCLYCGIHDTHLNNSKFYDTDCNFFSHADSEIKAYLLGLIAGDGHISKNYQYLEVVANNQDISSLNLFREHISPNNTIRAHSTSKNCSKIIICSVQLCKDICGHLQIKSGKKSDKISLPPWQDELLIPFIRGLVDSDGWVKKIKEGNRGRSCFYSSTSNMILRQVKEFLKKFKIDAKVEGIKLRMSGDNASRFLDLIYGQAKYFLPRKYNRFTEWNKK